MRQGALARYSVRILARYWYELEAVPKEALRSAGALALDIELSSVHAAKGLEADFVILVGLGEGENGFPARETTDPFRELFLPEAEPFRFAEERRLSTWRCRAPATACICCMTCTTVRSLCASSGKMATR